MNWQPFAAASVPPLNAGFVWSKSVSEPDSARHVFGAENVTKFISLYGASKRVVWAPMTPAEQKATRAEYRRNGWL